MSQVDDVLATLQAELSAAMSKVAENSMFNDIDNTAMRNEIIGHLKRGVCHITFTKRDGTERTMRASLKDDLVIPYEKKTDRKRAEDTSRIFVFDLDKQEWRSFKVDSVKTLDVYFQPEAVIHHINVHVSGAFLNV